MSKRELAANILQRSGALSLLERFRSKPAILIVNHHRVGNAAASRFDRDVFSASAEGFEMQLKYFKRYFPIVAGQELEDLVSGTTPLKRTHIAITFDDGYRNDYTTSFEILKANNAVGTFFLVPEYVGTATIPWWDEIAYLVRNSPRSEIVFEFPAPLTISLDDDREQAIRDVLRHYKRPDNTDSERFMNELRQQACCTLPAVDRRFITWEEAREMQAAGMTIGSHTQTHGILGQMPAEAQQWELVESRKNIEAHLGTPVRTLAYPVGIHGAFTETTEKIARDLGYTLCFSFYGGINMLGHMQPTNLLRMATNRNPLLFRAETVLLSRLGKLPY
ncbi:MAG TPA: polysaccharide deacetylase family protein [Edaphobacter sp.]|nr:polysaccharide deacetylase family protein [Edaphobacter sp.]